MIGGFDIGCFWLFREVIALRVVGVPSSRGTKFQETHFNASFALSRRGDLVSMHEFRGHTITATAPMACLTQDNAFPLISMSELSAIVVRVLG